MVSRVIVSSYPFPEHEYAIPASRLFIHVHQLADQTLDTLTFTSMTSVLCRRSYCCRFRGMSECPKRQKIDWSSDASDRRCDSRTKERHAAVDGCENMGIGSGLWLDVRWSGEDGGTTASAVKGKEGRNETGSPTASPAGRECAAHPVPPIIRLTYFVDE